MEDGESLNRAESNCPKCGKESFRGLIRDMVNECILKGCFPCCCDKKENCNNYQHWQLAQRHEKTEKMRKDFAQVGIRQSK